MYPAFARIAKEEGFDTIAFMFEEIAKIEKKYEMQLRALLESLESGATIPEFSADTSCLNCGHDFRLEENLEFCPVCGHSSAYFMKKD